MPTFLVYKRVQAHDWGPGKAYHTEYSLHPWSAEEKPWRVVTVQDGWRIIDTKGNVAVRDNKGHTYKLANVIYEPDKTKFHGRIKINEP